MSTAPEVGRAFVAVSPPGEVLDAVEALVEGARRAQVGPRWARREQWHLTLLFLGPVADLAAVTAALDAVAGLPPVRFRLGGGGAFPNLRRARVLWLGAAEGEEALAAVAAAVTAALAPLGYAADHDRFRPHLTLARLKVPGEARHAVDALGTAPVGPAWTIDEVVLYQSHLSREGAQYEALHRVRLGGEGS